MKKVLSVFLAIIMVISLIQIAFASNNCDCGTAPVVMVRGFGSALFTVLDDGTVKNTFPPDTKDIIESVPAVVSTLTALTLTKNYDAVADGIINVLDTFIGAYGFNETGNSVNNLIAEPSSPADVDTHKNTNYSFCRYDMENTGDYLFQYDWRKNPTDVADELNTYIQQIKVATGHSKVVLCAHSEGNNVSAAYLAKYGSNDVEKVLFLSSAVNGLKLVGQLFTRDVTLQNKTDELEDFLRTFIGNEPSGAIVSSFVSVLNDMGLLDRVNNELVKLLDAKLQDIYDEYLVDTIATMPGVWSFVPDEYYETAKEKMFGSNQKYSELISAIDEYHYGVQCNINDIILSLKNKGIPVAIACGYGISPIPVYEKSDEQCDMLIDTKYMSFGATCAKIGTSLQNNGSKYMSPDYQIDASTCLLPDCTWFVKYQDHNDFCDAYRSFLTWIILSDTEVTVNSNESYPQFLICNGHKTLVPVTANDDIHTDKSDFIVMLEAFFALIKNSFESLRLTLQSLIYVK